MCSPLKQFELQCLCYLHKHVPLAPNLTPSRNNSTSPVRPCERLNYDLYLELLPRAFLHFDVFFAKNSHEFSQGPRIPDPDGAGAREDETLKYLRPQYSISLSIRPSKIRPIPPLELDPRPTILIYAHDDVGY